MSNQRDATHGECAYLCFAWGESDLPVAVIAPTRAAVLQFFGDEWFGEQPEKMGSDNRAEWDAAVIHFDTHDWRDGPLKWTFEIGGIEITKVSAVSEIAPSAQLLFAYEAVLTEMRTHAKSDTLIAGWVKRLDFERDEAASARSATRPKSMDIAFCPSCEKEWSK